MEDTIFEGEQEGEFEIRFDLEEDTVRNDELSSGRSSIDENYRALEQQLLQEGKLGDTEISARIQGATFGLFKGQQACLIHFQVDFSPKNGKSFFRFRSATIQIEFEDVDSNGTGQTQKLGSSSLIG